ncbi:MAG: group III truncated hemoglobin [Flavobacteriales bacterium]|jgi:hemoglobin
MNQQDIATEEDVRLLVDRFYDAVLRDDILSPFFRSIDFHHHKPKMVDFWSFVLLDKPGYTTNIFDKHAAMALTTEALARWTTLFEATVRQLFAGEKADTAILRAKTIAWTFKEKMHLE